MEFDNYLNYGLLEIVLLVIGILVALQINNWNEGRKEKQLDNQLFEAIINDLDLDKSSEEIVKLLNGKEEEFISYLSLFRNGVFHLNERFEESTTSIKEVINNLKSYKNTVPEIL